MGQPTRAEDIADPNVAMERGRTEASANLNKEFEIARPMEWAPALAGAGVILGKIRLAVDAGVKLTIATQSQGPIYPLASGIPRYIGSELP